MLKNYLSYLLKHKIFIIVFTLLVLSASLLFNHFNGPSYKTIVSFDIRTANQPVTTDYQYEGYYALQASELFGQTILSWFLSPAFEQEVFQTAGVEKPKSALNWLKNYFQGKQLSAQLVTVKFSTRTKESAQKLAGQLIALTEAKAAQANLTSEGKTLFSVKASQPVISNAKLTAWLVGFIALVVGLFISWAIVTIAYYYQQED